MSCHGSTGPQKHNYICSEERTVVHCAVLTRTEVRASRVLHCEELPDCSHRRKKGYLESVDRTTGLDYWNGLNCCKSLFLEISGKYLFSHFTNLLHALCKQSWGSKVTAYLSSLNWKAGVRLSLEKLSSFSHLQAKLSYH